MVRVKGLPGWLVVGRHTPRNSLTSVLTASETSLWVSVGGGGLSVLYTLV